jgi:hypothetical protein
VGWEEVATIWKMRLLCAPRPGIDAINGHMKTQHLSSKLQTSFQPMNALSFLTQALSTASSSCHAVTRCAGLDKALCCVAIIFFC